MTRPWIPAAGGSGPGVARLFHRLLALIFLVAWLSLGAQIDVLIGARGLLPAAPYLAAVDARGIPFHDFPCVLRLLGAGDAVLHAGVLAGVLLSLAALAGLAPRACFAAMTALYLGYTLACRSFLSFQWDNLLLECGLLAAVLPRDRPARWAHFLFRLLLFKLYWESGLAKWQSPLGDWQDGSAMTFYYETAPLPAPAAHMAHALPAVWHHFESWFTLAFELLLPFAAFAGRRPRLAASAVLTGFQIVNIATANYGFFAYLAIALHAFLLDDRDLRRVLARAERAAVRLRRLRARLRLVRAVVLARARALRGRLPSLPALPALPARARLAAAALAVIAYVAVSVADGLTYFADDGLAGAVAPIREIYGPFRLVSSYHLFAAITRERIEPEVQTTLDGTTWIAHAMHYKPGDPGAGLPLVAPHQPRVDFLLWFYGLSFRRGTPAYVATLLDRVCHDPDAVQPLFPAPLPSRPLAVRIVFQRYRFTDRDELDRTGATWSREFVGATRPAPCD